MATESSPRCWEQDGCDNRIGCYLRGRCERGRWVSWLTKEERWRRVLSAGDPPFWQVKQVGTKGAS